MTYGTVSQLSLQNGEELSGWLSKIGKENCWLRATCRNGFAPKRRTASEAVILDAVHYKVMDDKDRVVTRAVYNVLGLGRDGHKDLLGMYLSKSEGANFWLCVLTDLQNRGVKDIMIACIDGLKGFPEATKNVFPNTSIQLCVIH